MQAPPLPPQKANNNVLWIVLGVIGVCGCAGVAILAAILFPVFQSAKVAATRTQALTNVKQSALGLIMYTADNNEFLPPGNQWMDKSTQYVKNQDAFKSPAVVKLDASAYGFAFRKEISGIDSFRIIAPNETAMVFDSTITSRNATSGIETLPSPPRYGSVNMIGFADGHAKAMLEGASKEMDPKVALLPK